MITDQPTDSPADTSSALTAAASMHQFLIEYPQFSGLPIVWQCGPDGHVRVCVDYLHPDSDRIVADLAAALRTEVIAKQINPSDGTSAIQVFCSAAQFDGSAWDVRGYLLAEASQMADAA